MREISSQCRSKLVLSLPHKPLNPIRDAYDGQLHDLTTGVDIWERMDVVPVEYVIFYPTFHLTM